MPCMNLSDEREFFETTARPLLDEVDGDVEIVNGHPIADVAVEAIRLLDEDRAAGRIGLDVREHLRETCAARLLRGLDIDELAGDRQPVLARVLTQQSLLRGNREALALLVLGGNPRVQDR